MKDRLISLSILAALVLVAAPAYAAEVETATDTVSFRQSIRTELRACRSLVDVAAKLTCQKALRERFRDWRQNNTAPARPFPLRRPAVTSYIHELPEDLQKRIEACRAETDLEDKKECRMKIHEAIKEYKQANGPAAWPESLKQDIQACRRDNRPNRTALSSCIEDAFSAAGIDMPAKGPWTNVRSQRKRAHHIKNLSEETRTQLRECREKSNGDLKVFRECTASITDGSLANTRLPHRFTKYKDSLVPRSDDDSSDATTEPTHLTPFSVKPIKSWAKPSLTPTW